MKSLVSLVALVALAGCSLLHSPPAEAGTSTVTWVNPATNTDNSAIVDDGVDESSLSAWRIEYGTCSAPGVFGSKVGEVIRPRPAGGASLTSAVLNTQSGLKCFRVLVKNLAGAESVPSNVASRTVEAPVPKNPTSVTATP